MLRHLMKFFARDERNGVRPDQPPRGSAIDAFEDDSDHSTPQAIPIEDWIDLHTFSPRETSSVVDTYITEAHAMGFDEVRIVHGRGKGVQRHIVRSALARHCLVVSFQDAPPAQGGWGATVARLVGQTSAKSQEPDSSGH